MSSSASWRRRHLSRSLAGWGVTFFCMGATGCSDSESAGENAFKNPDKLIAHHGAYQLSMQPAKVTIDGKNYCLRTYNGKFPSPTIEVANGTARSIRLDLTNNFTKLAEEEVNGHKYDFNITNLHTHGLHVRPEKTADASFQSDNVLLDITQGNMVRYRFDLDEFRQHEAGTYWYHPHVHGSTAIQVANGMAGALIVRGKVDELPGIREAEERIFVLGQIPYDHDSVVPLGDKECTDSTLSINKFALVAEAKNTLINGILHPTLTTHKNQVERWRFIHAGVSAEVTVGLRKANSNGSCSPAPNTANIPVKQIAADGYTYMKPEEVNFVTLQPGNRADVMMQAPGEEGTYCVLNLGSAAKLVDQPSAAPDAPKLLAYLKVDAQEGGGMQLSDAALASVATPPLNCDASLEIKQARKMIFAQQKDGNGGDCEGKDTDDLPFFNINCKVYDHHAPAEPLPFDKTEEWELSSENGFHPFHIHVNSFTVCPGSKLNGQEIKTARWMDTLVIRKEDTAADTTAPTPIKIRTHYEHYKGKFVMHCHRLNHEDEGMMQQFEIR